MQSLRAAPFNSQQSNLNDGLNDKWPFGRALKLRALLRPFATFARNSFFSYGNHQRKYIGHSSPLWEKGKTVGAEALELLPVSGCLWIKARWSTNADSGAAFEDPDTSLAG